MAEAKRTVNKRAIVATLYRDGGTFKVAQEMITYQHRTQVPQALKDIQDRVNEHYKFQEQSLFFMDEK